MSAQSDTPRTDALWEVKYNPDGSDLAWHVPFGREALNLSRQLERELAALRAAPQGEWHLPSEHLNKPQLESIAKLVQRTKQAHYTNVVVRINGENETYEADWIKHMTLTAALSRHEERPALPAGQDRAV